MESMPIRSNATITEQQSIDRLATKIVAMKNVHKNLLTQLDDEKKAKHLLRQQLKDMERRLRCSNEANDKLRQRNGQLCKQVDNLRGNKWMMSVGTQTINEKQDVSNPMWKYSPKQNEKFIINLQSFHFGQYSRSKIDVYCDCFITSQFAILNFQLVTKNNITGISVPLLKQTSNLKMTAKLRAGSRVIQRRIFGPATLRIPGIFGPARVTLGLKLVTEKFNFKLTDDLSLVLSMAPHSTLNKLVDPVRAQFGLQDFVIYGQCDLPETK